MSEYLFILPIILSILLGSISPGPSFFIVTQTAMSKSRNDAIAIALGLGVGASFFALVACIGLYIILENVPWMYVLFKILGGIYLCFLAYKIWKSSKINDIQKIEKTKVHGIFKSFLLGLFTQITNPKTAIVFGGIFAAFLPANVPEYSYLILCVLSFSVDAIWYIIVAYLMSTKKAQNAYYKHKKRISIFFSGFLGLMGIKLAFNI